MKNIQIRIISFIAVMCFSFVLLMIFIYIKDKKNSLISEDNELILASTITGCAVESSKTTYGNWEAGKWGSWSRNSSSCSTSEPNSKTPGKSYCQKSTSCGNTSQCYGSCGSSSCTRTRTWTRTSTTTATCTKCKANYYLNNGQCTSCPSGKTSSAGSTSSSDCKSSATSKPTVKPTTAPTSNRPCCDACGGNAFCLANCRNCTTPAPTATSTPKITHSCGTHEHWDAKKSKCVCDTGYTKNGMGTCSPDSSSSHTPAPGICCCTPGRTSCSWYSSSSACNTSSAPIKVEGATSSNCSSNAVTPTPEPSPVTCAKGEYLPLNSKKCDKCKAGYYCPGGKYKPGSVAQGLKECAAGTYSVGGQSSCSKCPDGYTSDAQATSSNKCYINGSGGKFYQFAGNTLITGDCSPGYYSVSRKIYYQVSNLCIKCDAGKCQNKSGQTSCNKCDKGQISEAGSASCTTCPDGTKEVSNKTCDKCIPGTACKLGIQTFCSAGYYSSTAGASECTECPAGTISTNMMNTECRKCQGDTIAVDGKKCVSCSPGQANDDHTECLTEEENVQSIRFTKGPTNVAAMKRQKFTYAVDSNASWKVSGTGVSAGAGCSGKPSKTCEVTFDGGECPSYEKKATITATVNGHSATKNVKIVTYEEDWRMVDNNYGPVSDAFLKSRAQMRTAIGCFAYENMRMIKGDIYYTAYSRCCGKTPSIEKSYCYFKKGNGTDNDYCYGTSGTCGKTGYTKMSKLDRNTCGENDKCYKKGNEYVVGKFEGQKGYTLFSDDVSKCESKPNPACYGNTKELSDATAVKYLNAEEGIYRFKYAGVSKEKCVITPSPPPSIPECKDKNIDSSVKVDDCNKCNDHVKSNVENTLCDTDGSFYKINSDIKYDISFNNNTSSDTIVVKSGLGFPFTITVKATKTVTGSFKYNEWENSYNKTKAIWKNTTNDRDKYMLENRMDEFENIVKGFNDNIKKYDNNLNPNVSFDINTNGSGKKENSSFQIVSTKSKDSEPKTDNKVFFTRYKEINGSDLFETYESFEYKSESEVILKPTEVYLNKITGELVDKSNTLAISGGNKIYASDLKSGEYPISVQLSNIDGLAEIKNNSCLLNILDPDLKYRIVDVANPFINKDYDKGDNWYNEEEDFTSVIKSDTWSTSTSPLYVFNLDSDSIKAIKNDNRSDISKNKYLGTCYLPDSIVGNEIKSIICDKIK